MTDNVDPDALRAASAEQLKGELREIQGYWRQKARETGLLTEADLDRYLGQ